MSGPRNRPFPAASRGFLLSEHHRCYGGFDVALKPTEVMHAAPVPAERLRLKR
jgi:hypothetical protein